MPRDGVHVPDLTDVKDATNLGAFHRVAFFGGIYSNYRRDRPTLSALESALGSHPCVALSSAQAFSVYLQLAISREILTRFGLWLPPSRRIIQRTGFQHRDQHCQPTITE